MSGEPFKYWAFISYSHQDRVWGNWLHKALETYVVPRRLVGRVSRDDAVPRRLFPIFRDRDELPSSANLGDVINQSLRQSRYQIVICSPRSAASRWVNEEVKYFKSLGRDDRVLCLIVDGEPNVFEVPGRDIEECFCPALRFRVNEQGEITSQRAEPIAADAREHADGKTGAKIKLIAGLLGVGLDELRRRERQRQVLRGFGWAALAALFIASVTGMWRWQQHQRAEQARVERLDRLVQLGQQELLKKQSAKAAAYLSAAYSGGRDTAAVRFMLARALPTVEALTPVHGSIGQSPSFSAGSSSIAFSADGRRFLGTIGEVAKIWDTATGDLMVTLASPAPIEPYDLRFSGNGQRVLISGLTYSGTARMLTKVWDAASGAELSQLEGVTNAVRPEGAPLQGSTFLPADPKMRHVITIDGAHRARIWDASTGRVLRELPGAGEFTSASFSGDGRRIVTGSMQGIVALYDAGTGAIQCSLRSDPPAPTLAFFSADGRTVYASSMRGVITVTDSACGGARGGFGGLATDLTDARLSADGRSLLEVGRNAFAVWNLETRSADLLYSTGNASTNPLWSVRPNQDGSLLLNSGDGGGVKLWDVRFRKVADILDAHSAAISFADFIPGAPRILTLSGDGRFHVWDQSALASQPSLLLAHGPTLDANFGQGTYDATFDAAGERVITAGTDGNVNLWNARSGKPLASLKAHSGPARCVRFSPDGRRIVTCGNDASAKIWDAANGELLVTMNSPDQRVLFARFSPDGTRLLTRPHALDSNPHVRFWDTATGTLLAEIKEHRGAIREAVFSPTGHSFVTASIDGTAKVWSATDSKLLLTLEGHRGAVRDVAYSADGSHLVTSGIDGSAKIWDARDGRPILSLDSADIGQLGTAQWNHLSSVIALGSQGGASVLWDVAHNRQIPLIGHTETITSTEFSPDDALLATAAFDGTIRIWDAATGMLLMTFSIGSDATWLALPWSVEFSPDGAQLVSSGIGDISSALVWDLRRETRGPTEIAAIVRCKVPWAVENETLVPHALELDVCAPTAP